MGLGDLARVRREVDQHVAAGDDVEATGLWAGLHQVCLLEAHMAGDVGAHRAVAVPGLALGAREETHQRPRRVAERRQ
jgi:hypothetical protein